MCCTWIPRYHTFTAVYISEMRRPIPPALNLKYWSPVRYTDTVWSLVPSDAQTCICVYDFHNFCCSFVPLSVRSFAISPQFCRRQSSLFVDSCDWSPSLNCFFFSFSR